MSELADQLTEQPVVADAVIPDTPADTGIEAEPKRLSLRDELLKSVEEVRRGNPNKDPQTGKFTNKPAETAPKEAAPAAEIPKTGKDVQPTAPSTAAVGPPPGWSQESKAFYNSLPADHPLRKDVLKREEEVSSGFKKYADSDKRYQEIEQVLAPVRQSYQQHGVQSDAEAIKRLFMWERMIRENPAQALPQLARQYGVDLSRAPSSEPSAAPDVTAQFRPVLDQFGNKIQHLENELQRSQQERISQELTTFAKDHPHFEKVRVAMGQLMQAGAVQPNDLEGAYQKAIWSDENVRKDMLAEADKKRDAELQKAQTERAAKAKAAAVSGPGRAPSAPASGVNGKAKGVRGDIMKAIEEAREAGA